MFEHVGRRALIKDKPRQFNESSKAKAKNIDIHIVYIWPAAQSTYHQLVQILNHLIHSKTRGFLSDLI